MADELDMDSALNDAALSPKKGSVDGQEFEQQSIKDLIALDRYLASKKAKKAGKLGIGICKVEGSSING